MVIGLVTKKNREYFKLQERDRLLSHQQQRETYWTRQDKSNAAETSQTGNPFSSTMNTKNGGIDKIGTV